MKIYRNKGILRLLLIIIFVSTFMSITSIIIIYKIVYNEKSTLLKVLCENQTEIIKAIYKETNNKNTVLEVLIEQKEITQGLGVTGEYTIGYLMNDSINFLLRNRAGNQRNSFTVPISSKIAIPMQNALQNRPGFVEGMDYDSRKVLSYVNFIPELNWGLVTKMDISEVRQPFYKAALIAITISLVLFLISIFVFRRVLRPITKTIEESEENYRRLFEYSAIPIWREDYSEIKNFFDNLKLSGITDFRSYFEAHDENVTHLVSLIKVIEINQKSVEFFNADNKEDVIKNIPFYFKEKSYNIFREEFIVLAEGATQFNCEMPILTLSGEIKLLDMHLSVVKGFNDTLSNVLVSFIDITEKSKKEEELIKLNRTLSALSKSSLEMTRAKDEFEYLNEICNIIIKDCGYELVWIGYAEDNEDKTVKPVAFSGFENGYLESLNITWSDNERGMGPTGISIRTGKPTICKDILTDPCFKPWREEALKNGYASSVALPLINNNTVFGSISIYSKEPDSFTNDEINLLLELANDLTYGIKFIKSQNAQKRAEEILKHTAERLEIAQNAAKIGTWDWNTITGQIDWSPQMYDLLGLDPIMKKASIETWRNVIHPDDAEIAGLRIDQALKQQTKLNSDYRVIMPDGAIHWLNAVGEGRYNEHGQPVRMIGVVVDITNRKLNEEAIYESQLKTSAILNSIADTFYSLDSDWRFTEVNPAAEIAPFGRPASELLGKVIWDLYPNMTRASVQKHYLDAAANHKLEKYISQSPLDKRWYEVFMQGRKEGVDVYMRDISERKLIEDTLIFLLKNSNSVANDNFFGSLAIYLSKNLSMEFVCIDTLSENLLSAKTLAIYSNGKFDNNIEYALNGTPFSEVVGKNTCSFKENVRQLFPNDSLLQKMHAESYICATLRSSYGKPIGLITLISKKPKKDIGIEETVLKLVAIRAAAELERIQSEKSVLESEIRYRRLFESAKDGILILDAQTGMIVDVNPYLIKKLGFSYQAFRGKAIWDLGFLKDIIANRDNFIKLQQNDYVRYDNLPLEAANGEVINAEFVSNVYFANNQKVIQCNIRDITERKNFEIALEKKNKELEEINATKDKFFKIIAHDMKNPFISLIGASELLFVNAGKYDKDKIITLSKILFDSAKNGFNMLLNLLDWARSQAGSIVFQPEKINVKDLIIINLSNSIDLANSKNINLHYETTTNCQVYADKNMLESILRNLINNAIKYTPKGGEVTVSSKCEDNTNTFSVKDTGVGIDKADFDKLFRTDIKYSQPGTEHEGGTSLGLLLCKEFVEKHRGRIWFESEVGKGTTFYFTLENSYV